MVELSLWTLGAVVGGAVLLGVAVGALGVVVTRGRLAGSAVSPALQEMTTAFARLEGKLGERVSSVDEKVHNLTKVFVNDRARGNWGELSLRRVLELAGLRQDHDFSLQVSGDNGRPDAVVHLPGGRKLVVDAKFPVARLVAALDVEDGEGRRRLMSAHAEDIVKEAKGLVSRGYHRDSAGGFVVMYLPHEGLYATAMDAVPDLHDKLLAMRVILAGPSTLFGLLCAAGHVIAEQRVVESAREILDEAKELRTRLGTFLDHLAKVGRGLGSAVTAYNGAVGAWTSRVTPQADRLADRAGSAKLPALDPVDIESRLLPSPETELMLHVAG